ncbi:hypothetical protein SK128_017655 [Halocaridina rubra]|uniref:Uncharacterized protein n=1 Tax=Halocaridina rubra TaxID=373956 RepID=A0AAN8WY57_HALRR
MNSKERQHSQSSAMKFCGYKFSLCLFIISIWGLIQLLLMGVLFYCETPAFLEDLPVEETYASVDDYLAEVHRGFRTNAFNCIIAACLYIVTLGVSGWQFYLNQKTTYQV